MSKSRDKNVDIYKGIAIMLVLVGHLYWNESIASLVYSFHLPLFFFVTGFFIDHSANKYTFGKYFISRVKNILFPYIIALIAFLGLAISAKIKEQGISYVVFELVGIFMQSSSAALEASKYQIYYWFMPFFFLYTIILFLIYKYLKNYILIVYVVSIIMAFGIYFSHRIIDYPSDQVPWAIDKLPFLIPLGILGNSIWKRKETLLKRRNVLLIITGLTLLAGLIYKIDLRILFIKDIFIYFVLALNGSIFIILLSDFLDKNLSDGNYSVKKLLVFLGENSMILYLIHGIVYPIWHGKMGSPPGYSTIFNITAIAMSIILTFVFKYFYAVIEYWWNRRFNLS
ncbi:acyltransferase family protein [Candidatus Dojkabacteria bacterium]|nr:acyltransferase family protein [Candidatus Dojkabacteria bacterium]